MQFLRKFFISTLFILSFLSANDKLDDIFDLDLEQLKNMRVTTASKSIQTLDKAPARFIVITKNQIEQRGYRGLDDLLKDLPAVQTVRYADSGAINQIGFRGIMGNNYFKILQDGIEIDQTDGEFMSVSMQYPLIGIEKVEILYGASSVIYGADAMSAVINLVTSSNPQSQIGAWFGENGYKYFHANSTNKIGDGLLSIKAHYHTDQDYNFQKEYSNDFKNTGQNNYFKPHETSSAHIRYINDGFETGLNYNYSSESTLISLSEDNANKNRNIFDKDANINTQTINTYLKYQADVFWDMTSTTTISFSQTEILDDSYFINRYTGKYQNGNAMKGYQHSKSQKYSIEEVLNKQIANHNIVLGVGFDYFDVKPIGYQGSSKDGRKYYLVDNGTYTEISNIEAPNYHETWHNTSIFMQDQISIKDNLELSIAARYDKNSNYDSTFNPRVALIHTNDTYSQKIIYSQAFLAPSNNVKYKTYGIAKKDANGNLIFENARVGNPDLKPEKSKTIEYNLFVPVFKNDEIILSAYYTTIKDMILQEEILNDGIYAGVEHKNPKSAQNAAEAKIYGADIGYIGRAEIATMDLSYWLNYSYINGEIDYKYDYDLPFIASHLFKAGATLKYGNFSVTPSLVWSSPIKVAPYDNELDKRVDGYFVANIYASYSFNKFQKLSLRVDNIFDKHYYGVRYNSSSRYKSPQDTRMTYLSYIVNF